MESSVTVLFLCLFVRVFTSPNDGGVTQLPACSNVLPQVNNANISNSSLKSTYAQGEKLTYICLEGYTGRIIFTCDRNEWVKTRKIECARKRCELPSDIPNGKFEIVNGNNFVYGTTIKYTCKLGYQIANLVDTRTCLTGGWSNRLPECKGNTILYDGTTCVCLKVDVCILPVMGRNITVDGLPEDDARIQSGHTLQFRCNNPEFSLVGPNEITCNENGEWSGQFSNCVETICEIKEIPYQVSVFGLPESNAPMRYGHKLQFHCSKPGMALNGTMEVSCLAGGTWSHPLPNCIEVICKEEQLVNVKIANELPGVVRPFKPQHTLTFQCISRNLIMKGQSSVTCGYDGKWSSAFPTCAASGACDPPPVPEFAVLTTFLKPFYSDGETVAFSCPQFYTRSENPTLICKHGTWNGFMKCYKPCILGIEDMDRHNIQQYYGPKRIMYSVHKDYIRFQCQLEKHPLQHNFYPQCFDGHMQLPVCQ